MDVLSSIVMFVLAAVAGVGATKYGLPVVLGNVPPYLAALSFVIWLSLFLSDSHHRVRAAWLFIAPFAWIIGGLAGAHFPSATALRTPLLEVGGVPIEAFAFALFAYSSCLSFASLPLFRRIPDPEITKSNSAPNAGARRTTTGEPATTIDLYGRVLKRSKQTPPAGDSTEDI